MSGAWFEASGRHRRPLLSKRCHLLSRILVHPAKRHERQLAAIEAVLAVPFEGPTVVISHHAPHPDSLEEKRATKPLDAAYASDLEALILRHKPDLWIHGHVHSQQNYMVGRTKVMANPRGVRHQARFAKVSAKNRESSVQSGPRRRSGYRAATGLQRRRYRYRVGPPGCVPVACFGPGVAVR